MTKKRCKKTVACEFLMFLQRLYIQGFPKRHPLLQTEKVYLIYDEDGDVLALVVSGIRDEPQQDIK